MLRYFFIILSVSILFSQAPNWDCDGDGILDNYNNFSNNGSYTTGVLLDGTNVVSAGDLFAAFVEDELRGVGLLSQVPDVTPVFGEWAGQYQFAILIYSNESSGEQLTFKYYDSETNLIYDTPISYEFIADMTEGTAVDPVVFDFLSSNISADAYETCSDNCESGFYDCLNICDGVAVEDECGICDGTGIAEGACDCNGNVLDCSGVCGGDNIPPEDYLCNEDGVLYPECMEECGYINDIVDIEEFPTLGCYFLIPFIQSNEACFDDCETDLMEHMLTMYDTCQSCVNEDNCDEACFSELDECGVCDGDNLSCFDCAGIPNGDNYLDCNAVCSNSVDFIGNAGYLDEFGYDECGVCGGDFVSAGHDDNCCWPNNNGFPDGTGPNGEEQDCDGVCGGGAVIDPYGVCCDVDDGEELDECGVCEGGEVDMDCLGVCFGDSVEDQCGVCNGDGLSCLATLSLGAFTATSDGGTLEILYDFSGLVSGFQFDVSGLDLIGGSGGVSGDAGLQVQAGPLETVIGFDLSGSSIAAGSGVLTILSFSDVTSDLTVLSLGNGGAVSGPIGEVFITSVSGSIDHSNTMDCTGQYYGSAVVDECNVCNGGGTFDECGTCDNLLENDCTQDCSGIWGGSSFLDCFGVCDGDATYDVCGVCDGDGSTCGLLDGHLNQETGWNFYQSSQIGFYGFQEVLVEGAFAIGDGWAPSSNAGESDCVDNPFSCDVVGAFLNGLCVGWVYADSNGETTVPVMGYDDSNATSSQQTQGYCTTSDIPIFLVFDSSEQTTYLLDIGEDFDTWNLDFYVYSSGISTYANIGCTNPDAGNYDSEAVIDDGSCIYMQSLSLDAGWNMFSFNLIPQEASLFDILSPIHNDMILVLDESGSAIFQDESGNNWYDNIGLWMAEEGYLIKMSELASFDISSNQLVSLPFVINLSKGWNLISYPTQSEGNLVENVLSDLIAEEIVYMMFDESGNVFIPSYVTGSDSQNSIISMSPGNGYYIKVLEDSELSIYESTQGIYVDESSDNSRTQHFTPIWDGNPFFPMTIIVDVATWNNVELVEGDEIGVFDGSLCVGAHVVSEGGFINNSGVEIKTSKDDPEEGINGFTNGNPLTIRLWRDSIEIDVDATILQFSDEEGNPISPVFEASSAPSLELNVYPPSAPTALNLDPLANMVYLQWSRPIYGDYLIYEDDFTTRSAVNFEVVRNGNVIYTNLINNSYADETIDYNTQYSYQISSLSELGFDSSISVEFPVLTRPGTPVLSSNSFVNSIDLNWSDPEGTGSESQIDYLLKREWDVGEQNYEKIFNNIFTNVYSDLGLLNSSDFSYKVRAHNNSGYSGWSDVANVSTLSFQNNLSPINIDDIVYTIQQNTLFPDNEIELDWPDIDNAQEYRVYDKNLLIDNGEVDLSYFSHDDLDNSTLYQYSITSINESGESEASGLLDLITLPEAAPAQPTNFIITSNQNYLELNWNHVQGYGDPIGGEAVFYRVYRFLTTTLNPDDLHLAVPLVEIGDNSFNDINLEDNMYYCYAVSGVNSEGLEGEKSLVVCNSTQTQQAASTPFLSSQVNDRSAYLSWNEVEGSPPITYQIYKQEKDASNAILYNQFVDETSNIYYIDENLGRGQTYFYYVTSRNELGASLPSNEASALIANQSSRLAAYPPENLLNDFPFTLPNRSTGLIPDSSNLTWNAAEFTQQEADSLFGLAFEGNGFSHMSIIANEILYNQENISDGSIVAVFDGELCVGKGITPLPYGQLSASADDGTGNGFTEGHDIYFRIWDSFSGNILTVYEDPALTFSQLGLEYVDLNVQDDKYNLYRNGNFISGDIDTVNYFDSNLESETNYFYRVSAYNELDFETESNVSVGDPISTDDYPASYPQFNQDTVEFLSNSENTIIFEDSVFNVTLSASDEDNDFLTFFAQPVNNSDPISCFVNGDVLQVIPAPDYFGTFDIAVHVYDDWNAGYESNTYSDEIIFTLTVNSVNDNPIRINYFDDLILQQADYCINGDCPHLIDISNYIIDVDNLLMQEESLNYIVQLEGDILDYSIDENFLLLNFLDTGQSEISISVSDQSGSSIDDSFMVFIEEILEADDIIPISFKLSEVYPNPFNPKAFFNVEIPYSSMIEINVYNILGQKIDGVFNGFILPGIHTMSWSSSSRPSGIYFVQIKTENFIDTKKMILLK